MGVLKWYQGVANFWFEGVEIEISSANAKYDLVMTLGYTL